MLKIAKKNKKKSLELKIKLHQLDVRNFTLSNKFDAAISLFNVVGYQATNSDFASFLENTHSHLKKGAMLLLYCWYLSAVHNDPLRNKESEISISKNKKIICYALSMSHHNNTFDVKFYFLGIDQDKITSEVKETHTVKP